MRSPSTSEAQAQASSLGAASDPAPASDPVTRWRPYIAEASARFGVPAEWIERVMRAESGGYTTLAGRPITSRAGAMGLMQLMPATWAEMRARHGLGADSHDPRDNILAGTAYLAAMHARFGYPGLFGAYNAGPARYAEWLAGGRPLPAETRAYLAQVAGVAPSAATSAPATIASQVPAAPPRARLFAIDRAVGAAPKPASTASTTTPDTLFAVRARPDAY
nr:lytic transglycosylase domain-containing protein [Tsuneonella deserti]